MRTHVVSNLLPFLSLHHIWLALSVAVDRRATPVVDKLEILHQAVIVLVLCLLVLVEYRALAAHPFSSEVFLEPVSRDLLVHRYLRREQLSLTVQKPLALTYQTLSSQGFLVR